MFVRATYTENLHGGRPWLRGAQPSIEQVTPAISYYAISGPRGGGPPTLEHLVGVQLVNE